MEQTKNKWMIVIIPVVAVVVILEAVVLVSGMMSKTKGQSGGKMTGSTTVPVEARMRVTSDKEEVAVGESGEVAVVFVDEVGHRIDGIQLYVTYDPEFFEVTDLRAGDGLGRPKLMTVSPKKKMIAVMYLVEAPEGLEVEKGGKVEVLTFKFKALKAGVGAFEVNTGTDGDDLITRVAETKTSRAVSFSGDKLVIKVGE